MVVLRVLLRSMCVGFVFTPSTHCGLLATVAGWYLRLLIMLLVSPSRILMHNYTTTLASPEDVNNHRAPDSARYQDGQRTWNSAESDSPHLRHFCHKSLDHSEAEHAANLKDQWTKSQHDKLFFLYLRRQPVGCTGTSHMPWSLVNVASNVPFELRNNAPRTLIA